MVQTAPISAQRCGPADGTEGMGRKGVGALPQILTDSVSDAGGPDAMRFLARENAAGRGMAFRLCR